MHAPSAAESVSILFCWVLFRRAFHTFAYSFFHLPGNPSSSLLPTTQGPGAEQDHQRRQARLDQRQVGQGAHLRVLHRVQEEGWVEIYLKVNRDRFQNINFGHKRWAVSSFKPPKNVRRFAIYYLDMNFSLFFKPNPEYDATYDRCQINSCGASIMLLWWQRLKNGDKIRALLDPKKWSY